MVHGGWVRGVREYVPWPEHSMRSPMRTAWE
jgi:hypothetical protein